MYYVTKMFRFEAAHQLDTAYSRECSDTIHGHSYRVEVTFAAKALDEHRMVVDLGWIGEVGKRIIGNWDHALILSAALSAEYPGIVSGNIIEFDQSPTAEVMAGMLWDYFTMHLRERLGKMGENDRRLHLYSIKVHETESGSVELRKGE